MTAELFLDTENVFHGFRPRPPVAGTPADTLQVALFGRSADVGRDGCVARLGRVVDAMVTWFGERSSDVVTHLHSFGKFGDPAVQAFLLAMADGEEGFARAHDGAQLRTAYGRHRTPEQKVLVSWFRRGDVQVVHRGVPPGPDEADRALVATFRERLSTTGTLRAVLLGGEDHDTVHPFDHALSFRDAEVWVVLPAGAWRSVLRFDRYGSYPHIRPANVVTLGELLQDNAGHAARARLRRRRDRALGAARRAAGAARAPHAPEGPGLGRSVEHRLALAAGVDPTALALARWGTPAWQRAVGDPWVWDAVRTELSAVASADEADAVARGTAAPHRVACLVRQCVLRRIVVDEPEVTSAMLLAYLATLANAAPYHRPTLDSCVTMRCRERGASIPVPEGKAAGARR